MFGLIRRISYSVIPRPDRPWEDDPTSNAPNTRRKRRLSSSERSSSDSPPPTPIKPLTPNGAADPDANDYSSRERNDDGESARKRLRSESMQVDDGDVALFASTENANGGAVVADDAVDPGQEKGDRVTEAEVKNVTEGVKEVELEDKGKKEDQLVDDAGVSDDHSVEKESDTRAGQEGQAREAEDKQESDEDSKVANPASIPLPEEKEGELDEEQVNRGSSSEEKDSSKASETKTVIEDVNAPSTTDVEPTTSPSKKPNLQSFRSPKKRPENTKV